MAALDPNKQYLSGDTQGLFGNQALIGGQKINYGGQDYNIIDNGNGTRSFTSAGGAAMGGGFGGGPSYSDFINGQKGQENDFLNSYKNAIGGQESIGAMAGRLGKELGLPELQKSAFGLNDTLANLPTTNANATRGFDVNQAQLDKINADSYGKLAPAAQRATAAVQNATGQLNTQLGYNVQDQAKQLQPYEMQAKMLSDRLAREFTGYTQDKQQQLDVYMEKMREGHALTLQENAQMAELARQEKEHAFQADQMKQKLLSDRADSATQFNRQKDIISYSTDQDIRKSKASQFDINGELAKLRGGASNPNLGGGTSTSNKVYGPPTPPSYFTPAKKATPSKPMSSSKTPTSSNFNYSNYSRA